MQAEICVRYFETSLPADADSTKKSYGGLSVFLLIAGFSVVLFKEDALYLTLAHFGSFIPEKYFGTYLVFPSLALWQLQRDTNTSVVGGSQFVILGEVVMLLKVYQFVYHRSSYAARANKSHPNTPTPHAGTRSPTFSTWPVSLRGTRWRA